MQVGKSESLRCQCLFGVGINECTRERLVWRALVDLRLTIVRRERVVTVYVLVDGLLAVTVVDRIVVHGSHHVGLRTLLLAEHQVELFALLALEHPVVMGAGVPADRA